MSGGNENSGREEIARLGVLAIMNADAQAAIGLACRQGVHESTRAHLARRSKAASEAIAQLLADARSVCATGDERTLRLAIDNLRRSLAAAGPA